MLNRGTLTSKKSFVKICLVKYMFYCLKSIVYITYKLRGTKFLIVGRRPDFSDSIESLISRYISRSAAVYLYIYLYISRFTSIYTYFCVYLGLFPCICTPLPRYMYTPFAIFTPPLHISDKKKGKSSKLALHSYGVLNL